LVVKHKQEEPSAMALKRIAIDTSKHVFTLHGVDHQEQVVLRRELKRHQLEPFFAKQPATEVVLEACGGSHHWGRRLAALGHRVRLLPPQYVKPFVKRGKNDRNDAAAISEAASRPSMASVPVKSATAQAEAMILSVRELLVRQRTQLINALRGHAAEFGVVAAQGAGNAAKVLERLAADPAVPEAARAMFALLGQQLAQLVAQLDALDRQLLRQHKANPVSRLLAEIPGIGPISGLSLALTVEAKQFRSGRHFAAWLGLTPKDHSTAGRQRLGGITRQGNERLRALLVVGATAVVRTARQGKVRNNPWLLALLQRRPPKLVAVALANKMARIVWAMMTSGEAYRRQPAMG
jgi:transposase